MARAATAYVQIKPDTKGFRRQLQTQLDAIKTVTVGVTPVVAGFTTFQRELQERLDKAKPTVKVGLEPTGLRAFKTELQAQLNALKKPTIPVKVKLDTVTLEQAGTTAVKTLEREITGRRPTITPRFNARGLFRDANRALTGLHDVFTRGMPGSLFRAPIGAVANLSKVLGSVLPPAVSLATSAFEGASEGLKTFIVSTRLSAELASGPLSLAFRGASVAATGMQAVLAALAASAEAVASVIGVVLLGIAAMAVAVVGSTVAIVAMQAAAGTLLAIIIPLVAGITALVAELTALAGLAAGGLGGLPGLFGVALAAFGPLLLVAEKFGELVENTAKNVGPLYVTLERLRKAIFAVMTSGFIQAIKSFVAGPLRQMAAGIEAVSWAWNRLLLGLVKLGSLDATIAGINNLLAMGAYLVDQMAAGVAIIGPALLTMAVQSGPAIKIVLDAITGIVTAFGDWVSLMAASGQMGAFFAQLGEAARLFFALMRSGLPVAGRLITLLMPPALRLLTVLDQMTRQFGDFLARVEGATAFRLFFDSIHGIVVQLVPLVAAIGQSILRLGPAFEVMNGAAVPALQGLVRLFTDLVVRVAPQVAAFMDMFTTSLASPAMQIAMEELARGFQIMFQALAADPTLIPAFTQALADLLSVAAMLAPVFVDMAAATLKVIKLMTTLARGIIPTLARMVLSFIVAMAKAGEEVARLGVALHLPGAGKALEAFKRLSAGSINMRNEMDRALTSVASARSWDVIASNADFAGEHMINMANNATTAASATVNAVNSLAKAWAASKNPRDMQKYEDMLGRARQELGRTPQVGNLVARQAGSAFRTIDTTALSSTWTDAFNSAVSTAASSAPKATKAGKTIGYKTAAGILTTLKPALASLDWTKLLKIDAKTGRPFYKVGRNIAEFLAKGITSGAKNISKVTNFLWKAKGFKGASGTIAKLKKKLDQYNRGLTVYDALARKAGNLTYWQNIKQAIVDLRGEVFNSLTAKRDMVGLFGFIPTPAEVQAQLNQQLAQLQTFRAQVDALARKGLDRNLIASWLSAGPEQVGNLVAGLQAATAGEIAALNSTWGAIGTEATAASVQASDAMYGVGLATVNGYIKAIQDNTAKVGAELTKMFKAAIDAAKKALKIKSPSVVFGSLGTNSVAGYVNAVHAGTSAAVGSVSSMFTAVADLSAPVLQTAELARPAFAGTAGTQMPVGVGVKVYIGERELTDIVRVETARLDEAQARALLSSSQRGG